jgi:hypothetical protein
MGALLDVFVHKAKEECMCDLLTIFLHDADKDELIARWATAFPSDFSHDAKAYARICVEINSERSSSVTSTSIRLILGRIDGSRRVFEAQ